MSVSQNSLTTNFPNGLTSMGVFTMGVGGLPFFTGNYFFVNPATGSDGGDGSAVSPFQTLYYALSQCVSGNNDCVVLIGNGEASGSARLSKALAQTYNPAATAGTLNWNKDATHLWGVCAPTMVAQRARIAPPSGTYTQATFGSGNFVVVTGNGCSFGNFSLFNGFSTGGTNQICWTDNGNRNAYQNVDFGGIGDAASAADTGSRSLKVGAAGSGENTFYGCTFGLDTVTRSVANASVELAGGTPRNAFINCQFIMDASANSPLHILGTGADCIDRVNRFRECEFYNAINSGATTINEVLSFTNASPGGLVSFKSCTTVGATKWGDTNGLANSYVDGGAPTAASTGLAVNPS
ncbi:MAG: hypothetical protein KGL39_04525 [Patescibacteria group bacterium]|nr:hypothetical protein [Patescibacteria group bacterium]